MRVIISPAKKMNVDTDTLAPQGVPAYAGTVLRGSEEALGMQ